MTKDILARAVILEQDITKLKRFLERIKTESFYIGVGGGDTYSTIIHQNLLKNILPNIVNMLEEELFDLEEEFKNL